MIDWIFEGIANWVASIMTQVMDAVSGVFLEALGTDMTAMEEYFPFVTAAYSIMQYTAWALLFLIVVWQLFRTFGGPITEAEHPFELLARGADKAVLVSGREFGGSDTFATSQILAAAVNKIGVGPEDVVFCGRQAIDGDTAQVGPQIAEKLHLPQVTYVADIQKDGNTLTVKRMLEDGYMMVKVQTPCLLTCIKELNQPRYMSVNGIFTCYDKPMEVFDYNALKDDPLIEVDTIGLKGSPTNVFKSFTPPQKGAGTMLKGDDTAAQLAGILAKKHLI